MTTTWVRTNANGNSRDQSFLGFTPEREPSDEQTDGHPREREEQEVSG